MNEIKKEQEIVVKCDKNWILEALSPWTRSNPKRWKNYFAVVTRNEDGKFNYNWLKESHQSDEWFYINEVNVGDILVAGVKDYYKPNRKSEKVYYRVLERTTERMVLKQGSSFRQVSNINDIEETTI